MTDSSARSASPIFVAVALVAAAALQLEILVSRFFSVLFFYHFSFFAVSIVMTGITLGGLLSARWLRADADAEPHLVRSASVAAAGTVLATLFLAFYSRRVDMLEPAWHDIVLLALAYLPALTASGYFLATAFARNRERIGRLYAVDLIAAAAAVAGAVIVMRVWQGVAAAFVPALLAALGAFAIAERRRLAIAAALVLPLGAATLWSGLANRPVVPLPEAYNRTDQLIGPVVAERWNEHSRVIAVAPEKPEELPRKWLFIDKEAATHMYAVDRREPGAPPPIPSAMKSFNNSVMYRLPRPLDRVAVIGIGGGQDLLIALGQGAKRVEGYELNAIFRDWLREEFHEYSGGVATWPEVEIVHDEGRVGIASSGRKYDLIVASMIDTWAATANGGFVLSENSLYTVEGWEELLNATTPTGALAMTRWYLPGEPVELQRLLVVAAEALERIGVTNPAEHVAVIAMGNEGLTEQLTPEQLENLHLMGTLIASRAPITKEEITVLAASMVRDGVPSHVLYPNVTAPPWVRGLLDPSTREAEIARSEFDITATTDDRPYFFLQLRMMDIARLFGADPVGMRKITFNGVRVLVIMVFISALFAAAVIVLAPGRGRGTAERNVWGPLSLYFAGIGLGFVLVQIGILGRLIIPLGHPTYAFTTILFSMLLATGVGSWLSARVQPRKFPALWWSIAAGVLLVALSFPLFGAIGHIESWTLRIATAALPPAFSGLLLGFCFPIGVRLAEPLGEGAVQRLWAINGAAGILGSAAAALVGVLAGGRATVIAGALCYALVAVMGTLAARQK